VSIAIPAGSVTALIGPNGAGKSTLLRCFMGFEAPSSGHVRVRGLDPLKAMHAALQHVGYVGQDAPLYRELTVADHVALAGALRRGFDTTYASRRLSDLGIRLSMRAGELSGGQRSQVALAIALATRAPILILDEPVANLDPLARRDFLNVLRSAARDRGTTVLLASHIVADFENVCDSIIVLAPATVLLHASMQDALRAHRVVPATTRSATDAVSSFHRSDGSKVYLVKNAGPGEITLEDLVLGYLAAASPVGVQS
jgi:ABC-2 type transport system ATP-binding protein